MGRLAPTCVEHLHKVLYEDIRTRYPDLLIETWDELTEEQRIRIREAQDKHVRCSNIFER